MANFRDSLLTQPVWWLILILFWAVFVVLSYRWNYDGLEREAYNMAALRGRLVFNMVEMTRHWNAAHGGVYAPVTGKTPPNDYLDVPEKVIETPSGKVLTMVNPAYMTRQLSTLLAEKTDLRIHLTSLKPINPGNAPDPWERESLESFENGVKERVIIEGGGADAVFRFMAPLPVVQPCLKCHEKQGYRLGQIRGGISVTQPASYITGLVDAQKQLILWVHLAAFSLVSLLSLASLWLIRRHVLEIAEERDQRRQVADTLASKLVELEQTREELVHSEKMASLGRMVAGFAHEVNTPVGVAVGAASHIEHAVDTIEALLRKEEVSEEELLAQLRDIRQASGLTLGNLRRAAQLVQSFKRTSLDQTSEACRSYAIAETIDDTLRSLHNVFKKTAIRISVDCPTDLKLYGPVGAVEQILTNLLMNSHQHAYADGRQGGEVSIAVHRSDGLVELRYRDDGKGMDSATVARIFEPFFTTERSKGGSGLGMYIVYNLATRSLGGAILCESSPGKGASFILRFPAHVELPVTASAQEVELP